MKKNKKLARGGQESLLYNTWKNKSLVLMALPVMVLLIMFNYVPMFGSIIAFKKFNFQDGILGSPWVGLDNFKFLFSMKSTTWRMLRNTVGYYVLFTLVGTVCNVALAIALNECCNKRVAKLSQTFMIMPTFISYIAVSYVAECFLARNGIVNSMLQSPIMWYQEAKYWPVILTIVDVWKGTGYGSVVYLSALAGIDQELFEAAELDGATKMQRIRYITLPLLASTISIVTLMGLSSIMSSNTGLFYQVTKDSSMIYETTQTIDTYVLKALFSGSSDFGPSSAVSFFQAVVGSIMVIGTNLVVRKKAPDAALF
ncbi:MAG: sugar ABC transporter permease [Lachnospiraceae bacterium]|nr:sugar ABC transporter permease [Lachnospiraceae bacterium]MBQ8190122.1 sugar ABC transporter permease [Lachnospiraceae bacterium]MBQ8231282.1 sugar ABC transporter permease [Lachnospiraceae bacterium]